MPRITGSAVLHCDRHSPLFLLSLRPLQHTITFGMVYDGKQNIPHPEFPPLRRGVVVMVVPSQVTKLRPPAAAAMDAIARDLFPREKALKPNSSSAHKSTREGGRQPYQKGPLSCYNSSWKIYVTLVGADTHSAG